MARINARAGVWRFGGAKNQLQPTIIAEMALIIIARASDNNIILYHDMCHVMTLVNKPWSGRFGGTSALDYVC